MSANPDTARTLHLRVLGSGATPEQIARAVDRHDRTSPDRVREHHEYARRASPGHHAHLDHLANLRTLREHPDHVAALQEIARDQIAQAHQARAWVRARAQANLDRLATISPHGGFDSSWYGLGTLHHPVRF